MPILGIDLGTTNSAVAIVNEHGAPELLANRDGEYITPSVVFFEEDGSPIVGSTAKRSAMLDPTNVVQFVKRQMGNRDWAHPAPDGKTRSAEEISALILRRLREDAEAISNQKFEKAVISVPAYFQDAQRTATQVAGEMAGLDVVRVINEPTAAALAFGVSAEHEGQVVVYDLGGGTFDVTVLTIGEGELKVLASGGDKNLGGLNWDNELMTHLQEAFQDATGAALTDDPATEQALRDKAEAAKLALSSMSSTKVVLTQGADTATITITREKFEELTADLLDETRVHLAGVVQDAGLEWSDITKVLLVGGSTKMPAVAKLIEQVTGMQPSREVHPDEAVALGAAIQGAMLERESARSEPGGGAVGPDELGLVEIDLTDVTAHGIGFVLLDFGTRELYNEVVVEKDTPIPCEQRTQIGTVSNGQRQWKIELTQGDDRDPRYVTVVGEGIIDFDGPKPEKYPIDVEMRYDADGVIHVFVYDGVTNKFFGELDIERKSNLTAQELADAKARVAAAILD